MDATATPVLDWLATDGRLSRTPIVDRIVPATTAADRDAAAAALGVRDEMAVVGEPYRQWVLQDSFVAARPPLGARRRARRRRTSRPTS